MTIKTPELVNEVIDLYQSAGYGYRRIAKYLAETKDIHVSYLTVKSWLQSERIDLKNKKFDIKKGSKNWYKQEYEKLLAEKKSREKEIMELKEALDRMISVENRLKILEDSYKKQLEINNILFKKLVFEFKRGNIDSIENEINLLEDLYHS